MHADTLAQPRWGLERAQTVFPHPIHFGVFCASVLGLAFYSLEAGRNLLRRTRQTAIIGCMYGVTRPENLRMRVPGQRQRVLCG